MEENKAMSNKVMSRQKLESPTRKQHKVRKGAVPRQSPRLKSDTKSGAKRDPVELVAQGNEGRDKRLIPIRHSRMLVSPFTFYRGAASLMAHDLALEPHSGIKVQCCGDCHILNFGAFATPERNIIADFNDFDETLLAPFEWDLKRLATSFVIAADSVGLSSKAGEKAALQLVSAYQKAMAKFAKQRLLDVWHEKQNFDEFLDNARDKEARARGKKYLSKELIKSSPDVLQEKLLEKQDGEWRFKEMPPLLYHEPKVDLPNVRIAFDGYLKSLSEDKQMLLQHFEIVDIARKVVGTGSVGTFCGVLLLEGENDDLLILQIKEARQSVFEPYLGESEFDNHGQRVVIGQRIMQSASDMFLGWTVGKTGLHLYIRQLRDVKLAPNPAMWNKTTMWDIAIIAGKVLAKAHARSGAARAITEYLGESDKFAKSMSKYALSYAEQTNADYRLFAEACQSKRLPTEASSVG